MRGRGGRGFSDRDRIKALGSLCWNRWNHRAKRGGKDSADCTEKVQSVAPKFAPEIFFSSFSPFFVFSVVSFSFFFFFLSMRSLEIIIEHWDSGINNRRWRLTIENRHSRRNSCEYFGKKFSSYATNGIDENSNLMDLTCFKGLLLKTYLLLRRSIIYNC